MIYGRSATWLAGLLALPLSVVFTQDAAAVVPCPAGAYRCSDDWLTTGAAAETRLRWARRCALKNSSTSGPIDTLVPAANGGTLKEYDEFDPAVKLNNAQSYVGQHFSINSIITDSLYKFGPTTQTMVNGYYEWERAASLKWTKPLYPTYGTSPDPTMGDTLYPKDSDPNDCKLYKDRSYTTAVPMFYIACYCMPGCYTPEQQVLFEGGYQDIAQAMKDGRKDVITLSPRSTLEEVRLEKNTVATYITDLRDADHPIYDIRTDSGGHLRVTEDHPLVVSSGKMVAARTLRVGDELVDREGVPDRIAEIKSSIYHGKVYNLRPVTSDRVSNVLVAQGYLTGSLLYQGEYQRYLNRVIANRSIPEELVPE